MREYMSYTKKLISLSNGYTNTRSYLLYCIDREWWPEAIKAIERWDKADATKTELIRTVNPDVLTSIEKSRIAIDMIVEIR